MTEQLISKRTAWFMWLIVTIFYAYQYILRVLPGVLGPELTSKFHITVEDLSQFSGIYYIGYAGAHIPLGLLLDRKGLKYILPVCAFLTTLGLLPILFADQWVYPLLGRVILGMGSSAAALGIFQIVRIGFPSTQFTRMLGFCISIGVLTAIYTGDMVAYFTHKFNIQTVLYGLVAIGLILSFAMFILIPRQEGRPLQLASVLQDLKAVFGNTTVLSVCLFAGLMVGPLEGFADIWGAEFLHSIYHLDLPTSKKISSFMLYGMCFGTPILTFIADKTQAYFRTIIVAAFVMCVGFIYILTGIGNAFSLYIVFSIVGVMCGYQIIALYKATTLVPPSLVGLTTACTNMIIMLFGYLFHAAIGILIKSQWANTYENGVPVYSFDALISSVSVIPEALLVAGYGFILISRSLKNAR